MTQVECVIYWKDYTFLFKCSSKFTVNYWHCWCWCLVSWINLPKLWLRFSQWFPFQRIKVWYYFWVNAVFGWMPCHNSQQKPNICILLSGAMLFCCYDCFLVSWPLIYAMKHHYQIWPQKKTFAFHLTSQFASDGVLQFPFFKGCKIARMTEVAVDILKLFEEPRCTWFT